jgi:hypothetical protein
VVLCVAADRGHAFADCSPAGSAQDESVMAGD